MTEGSYQKQLDQRQRLDRELYLLRKLLVSNFQGSIAKPSLILLFLMFPKDIV